MKKGFTLIELLVVIAIIGTLSVIVLSFVGSSKTRSRDSRRVSDLKEIQTALGLYYGDNQNYPTTLNVLVLSGFISKLPIPPVGAGDTAYKYSALGSGSNCNDYHLGATLEDSSNKILQIDADAPVANVCDGSVSDFDGAVPNVYDIRP